MADDSINLEYKIKEITATLNEQHDTILLTEIVEFCGQNDLLEYKVSVDTLKEALNFYFKHKNRQKGKWEKETSYFFTDGSRKKWETFKCNICRGVTDRRIFALIAGLKWREKMTNFELREGEYKKIVISEARYALKELIEVAVYKNYEVDTFVRHVLDELNKMYKVDTVESEVEK